MQMHVKDVSTYRCAKKVRPRPVKRTCHVLCSKWKCAMLDVSFPAPFRYVLCASRGKYEPHAQLALAVWWPRCLWCGRDLSAWKTTHLVVPSNQQQKSLILAMNKQNEQCTALRWSGHNIGGRCRRGSTHMSGSRPSPEPVMWHTNEYEADTTWGRWHMTRPCAAVASSEASLQRLTTHPQIVVTVSWEPLTCRFVKVSSNTQLLKQSKLMITKKD
jgi:hypothetical protein